MSKRTWDSLKERYLESGPIVVTAHRGFSGRHPENTLEAFQAAVALGVDFVEFDVRCSSDGVPVIMHDSTVDRTTNGHGEVGALSLAELRALNASFWSGPNDTGERVETPTRVEARVPTLEETLELLAGKVFLNIQVYESGRDSLERICALYRRFDLYRTGFMMMGGFAVADVVRDIDGMIELCVGEERQDLARHQAYGAKFIQPWREIISPAFCGEIRRRGLFANMFYANTARDCAESAAMGMRGIMSDCPDAVLKFSRAPHAGKEATPCS